LSRLRRFFLVRLPATAGALLLLLLAAVLLTPMPSLRPDSSLRILDRHGVELYEFTGPAKNRRHRLSLDEISPWLVRTTLFREDRHFNRHPGVNPWTLLRAAVVNARHGRIVLGGSTITMQLARILAPRQRRSFGAKLHEILLALKLDKKLSKREILDLYLNRLYYGNQLFGCEAASRFYFGCGAHDLTLAQAAFLAVIPSSPSRLNPWRYPRATEAQARRLMEQMRAENWIRAEDFELARQERIETVRPDNPILAPHFVFRLLKEEEAGLYGMAEVRTTLDADLQRESRDTLRACLEGLSRRFVRQGAVLALDNRSGEWLVWVGSVDFWDEENGGQIDGASIRRQPGSALKPFLYAEAMRTGLTPASILPDIPLTFREDGKSYVPRNYSSGFSGPQRARVSLASSLNVPAVYLLSRLGTGRFQRALQDVGFASLDRGDRFYGLGLALGSGEVTLAELVKAYAVLARLGQDLPERKVISWRTGDGRIVEPRRPPATRRIDERSAWLTTSILSDNTARGLGFGEETPLQFPYQVAVKTGTSEGYRDNVCVGYTRDFTVGIWVGNFEGRSMHGVSGVTGAGPVFHAVMNLLYRRLLGRIPYGEHSLDAPPPGMVRLEVCPLSGLLAGPDCDGRISEWFDEEHVPKQVCDWHQRLEIDRRNDLLATERTPRAERETRRFVKPPAMFLKWARQQGLPLPPARPSALGEHEFAISFPVNGSIFQTLPDLPARCQTIRLELRTSLRNGTVQWLVDGRPLARTPWPYATRWPIRRGEHEIAARSTDGKLHDRVRVMVQ
jgi:penicillin-binding protein 1C